MAETKIRGKTQIMSNTVSQTELQLDNDWEVNDAVLTTTNTLTNVPDPVDDLDVVNKRSLDETIREYGKEEYDIDAGMEVSKTIVLTNTPQLNSETVKVNGIVMTKGIGYDYTVSGLTITFETDVIMVGDIVLVDYEY